MFILVFLVIGTSIGVLFWFYRRLNRIEIELWDNKRREAADTAQVLSAPENEVTKTKV